MKFLIFAPPYNENIGGHVALHKLCDLINKLGESASLVPMFNNNQISILNWTSVLKETINELLYYENLLKFPEQFYPRNSLWKTPLYEGNISEIGKIKDCVVVYPETTLGNPLGGKNIARWMLHNSGFFTNLISGYKGEVQFCYCKDFEPVGSPYIEVAPFKLLVLDIPWSLYEIDEPNNNRQGTAYALRKGKGKAIVHDLQDSICIDGMNHNQIAEIFKTVKMFISYDSNTFYSTLAVIAGAISVIVPDETTNLEAFLDGELRGEGIAYGFEDIPRAALTAQSLIQRCKQMEKNSLNDVSNFINFWHTKLNLLK